MTRVPKPAERFVRSGPVGLGVAEVIDPASASALAETENMTEEMLTIRADSCTCKPDDVPPPGPECPAAARHRGGEPELS